MNLIHYQYIINHKNQEKKKIGNEETVKWYTHKK